MLPIYKMIIVMVWCLAASNLVPLLPSHFNDCHRVFSARLVGVLDDLCTFASRIAAYRENVITANTHPNVEVACLVTNNGTSICLHTTAKCNHAHALLSI